MNKPHMPLTLPAETTMFRRKFGSKEVTVKRDGEPVWYRPGKGLPKTEYYWSDNEKVWKLKPEEGRTRGFSILKTHSSAWVSPGSPRYPGWKTNFPATEGLHSQ